MVFKRDFLVRRSSVILLMAYTLTSRVVLKLTQCFFISLKHLTMFLTTVFLPSCHVFTLVPQCLDGSWIRDFFSSRVQFTVISEHGSTLTNIFLVCFKGPFWDLCFFEIFINDLPTTLPSKIRLFADHCVVGNMCARSKQASK